MENPEEILHSLEEFTKLKPKDIPRELEEYLCFVAKTGDPVYQWSAIKCLFREKLVNVITEFYESCPTIDIPPCPNVELFNYNSMKNFILERLDSFTAAPFTVQRICELLTTPRKEYNRIDKYMRALEKNILVVSTTEPGNRRNNESIDGAVNGLESEHVEEMDDMPSWPRASHTENTVQANENGIIVEPQLSHNVTEGAGDAYGIESHTNEQTRSTITESTVLTCTSAEQQPYVSIEPVASDSCIRQESLNKLDRVSVTITAIPTGIQKRRNSVEPVISSESTVEESPSQADTPKPTTAEESVEEAPETPVHPETDKQSVIQQTVETADSTSSTFPQETEKEEVTSEPTSAEEKVAATPETNAAEPSDNAIDTEVAAPIEEAASECTHNESEPATNTIETEEISSTDVKAPADSETNIEKEVADTETEDKDAITSSTEEVPNEPTTSEDKVVIEAPNSEEVVKEETMSVMESKEVEPEVSESGSKFPAVQESDSCSSEQSEQPEPQTPMEVDDKSNELSSQFVEVISQSSDSSCS